MIFAWSSLSGKRFIYLPFMLCVIAELPRDKDVHKSTYMYRSSHWRCSVKNGVLKYFANFRVKYLCWSVFLIKRLQQRCFTVKFLREPILKNICE